MTPATERYDATSNESAPPKPASRLILTLLKRSRGAFTLAIAACVLNGVASVTLVATLNRALSQPSSADSTLAWRFALCAVVALATRIVSGVLFARLSQDTMAQLREQRGQARRDRRVAPT